jgi:hypothetical protein
VHSFGRYVDHFVRTADGWKLAYRRVVAEFVGELTPASTTDLAAAGYVSFARDRTDPSYDRRRNP